MKYRPKLDPKVDLAGATPETLAKALFRRTGPLPARDLAAGTADRLSKNEERDRKVDAIMADAFEDARKMCPSPEIWEAILEPLILKVFMRRRGHFVLEPDDLAGGTSNAIRVEFRPDKFREDVTVSAKELIAEAVALEEQARHG